MDYITFLRYICNRFVMKWKEFEKLVRKKGWRIVRHGAQHDIYEHPDKIYPIQIERHWGKEIKPGLLKRLMKLIED